MLVIQGSGGRDIIGRYLCWRVVMEEDRDYLWWRVVLEGRSRLVVVKGFGNVHLL